MEIERLWGQVPGWFATQDTDQQVRLLAWYRVHRNPTKSPPQRRADAPTPMATGRGQAFWFGQS